MASPSNEEAAECVGLVRHCLDVDELESERAKDAKRMSVSDASWDTGLLFASSAAICV